MKRFLIRYKSGNYKEFTGDWKGDSVWSHLSNKERGVDLHVNKSEVEYIEVYPLKAKTNSKASSKGNSDAQK